MNNTGTASLRKLKSIAKFLRVSGKFYFQNYNIELFVQHIENDPNLSTTINSLVNKYPTLEKAAISLAEKGIITKDISETPADIPLPHFRISHINSFDKWVAFCFCYIKAVGINKGALAIRIFIFETGEKGDGPAISRKMQFYNDCIEPIMIYFENSINDTINAQYILKRYKVKCEWYNRDLISSYSEIAITQKHLDEYLFEQGFTYSLSETSVKEGRIDNFAISLGLEGKEGFGNLPDVIVAETKIFSGRTKDVKDLKNQIEKRILDLNLTVGYAVIINKSNKKIKLQSPNIEFKNGFYTMKDDAYAISFIIINVEESFYQSTKPLGEVAIEIS